MARLKYDPMEPIFFTPPMGTLYRGYLSGSLYKGSGGAPKADPQIGQAALMEAQLGQEAFDFYKQEYVNNKPRMQLADELANKVQEQLIKSGEIANEQSADYYNYMTETFRPLEKDIVNKANEYDTAGRRESEAALGLSDVRQSFDAQRQMANRNNERLGINPNSGNAASLNTQMNTSEAIAGADAANNGRKRAEQTGLALKMEATNMGKGLPGNSLAAMQTANSAGLGAVDVSTQNQANQRGALSIMGQGYNSAMQGYNNQASILNQQYQNRVAAWSASQNEDSGMWSGVGAALGTAAAVY